MLFHNKKIDDLIKEIKQKGFPCIYENCDKNLLKKVIKKIKKEKDLFKIYFNI